MIHNLRSSLAAAVLLSTPVYGGTAIDYTGSYEGDALPDAVESNPQWNVLGNSGDAMAAIVDVDETRSLRVSSVGNPNTRLFWTLGKFSPTHAPTEAWLSDPEKGSTVDFRIKISDTVGPVDNGLRPGFAIQVSDGQHYVTFFFGISGITANGASVKAIEGIDNTLFNEYRIAFQNGAASLYAAGDNNAIFSNVRGATLSRNAVAIGDFSDYIGGTYHLDYLRWSNEKAEFSPPSSAIQSKP